MHRSMKHHHHPPRGPSRDLRGTNLRGENLRQENHSSEGVNGRLIASLRDLSHIMRSLYEGRGSQKRVLMVLLETGTITQRELTARLGIQSGSASEVIARLEQLGLIARTLSETDRRTADLSLTEEGLRQAEDALNQRRQRHDEMFSVLSEEEKLQLLALLKKLCGDWEHRYRSGPMPARHPQPGENRDCSHDCAGCPHPCGRGRNRQV